MTDPFAKEPKPTPITFTPEYGQDCTVEVSYQTVEIQKMFGPLIFADIRIRANMDTCEWIIERCSSKDESWSEVARIPGQIPEEFEE